MQHFVLWLLHANYALMRMRNNCVVNIYVCLCALNINEISFGVVVFVSPRQANH